MLYQIHITKKEEDGIWRHIPLYFLTTADFNVAKQNFENVVKNFFKFENEPEIKYFTNATLFGERATATGEITAGYNVCGTYCIAIHETFNDVPMRPLI